MTTVNDLVEATRSHLHGGARPQINVLNGSLDASTTSVVLADAMGSIVAGAILSIDFETMFVRSVSSQTATVIRAFAGSTAATHANSSLVYVNPPYTGSSIHKALSDDLLDLSSPEAGLFKVVSVDITFNSAQQGYNLTSATDVIDVLDVRYGVSGSSRNWPSINKWRLARDMNTSEFASGFALFIDEPVEAGRTMRVRYKAKFSALSTTGSSDVEATTGLHAEAHDIPPLGAAARLLAGRPVRRSDPGTNTDPRRGDEVSTSDTLNSPSALRSLRRDRINAEASRLRGRYPTKFKV